MYKFILENVEMIAVWVGVIVVYAGVLVAGFKDYFDEKKLNTKVGIKAFYFGKQGIHNSLVGKQRDISVADIVVWVVLMMYVGLFCFLIASPEGSARIFWNGTGKYVDDIPDIMFAGISVATIVTTLTCFSSKAWIGFGINDILNGLAVIRRIKIMLLLMSTSFLIIYLAPVLLNIAGYQLYFAFRMIVVCGFIMYLYLLVKTVWVVLGILFGRHIEQFCADNLYKIFWYKNRKRNIQEESDSVLRITEYLVWKYRKAVEKIEFDKLKFIKYGTNISKCDEGYRRKKIMATAICVFVISVITLSMYAVCMPIFNWKALIVMGCSAIVAGLGMANGGFSRMFIMICYGFAAYRFGGADGTYKQVRGGALWVIGKRRRYIRCVENILALYKVTLESQIGEMSKIVIDYLLQEMKEADKEEKNKIRILLIAIEYIHFSEKKEPIEEIRFDLSSKCVSLAEGLAVKATNSFEGDHVDLSGYKQYQEAKGKALKGE